MSELRGVIVSHAAVAQALVAAVTAITGIEGVLTAVSNEGCGTEALGQRLREAVGTGPAVLFVDLPGGSCFTSSARYAKQGGGGADVAVVTGVNLAMLLAARVPQLKRFNVGGVHHRTGRKERLRFVYLTDDEAAKLRQLAARGVDVTAQDVPTARAVPVTEFT